MSAERDESSGATGRTRIRRLPARGVYDRAAINAILDEALVCHVGFVDEDQPFVIPMLHARIDDRLYIHGSVASRAFRRLAEGVPACVTVTLLDGLVLARSVFHHSLNYRSVIVLSAGEEVHDRVEKNHILMRLVEHVVAGRWEDARQPTEKELSATAVIGFSLNECSAKVRFGPPKDDEEDYALPVWAGVMPLSLAAGTAQPDQALTPGIVLPEYIRNYQRPSGRRRS